GGAKPEHGRRVVEPLREVRQRRDSDPAADEQRPLDVEPEAVSQRAEDREPVAELERAEGARSGPDRVDQESELALGGEAEAHRPRQQPSRSLEHEELAREPRIEVAALNP